MLVRPARTSDLPAMAAIKHDAGLAAWAHILPPAVIETLGFPDRWAAAVDSCDPRVCVLNAEIAGQVVGFAVTRPSADTDADAATGELDGFCVDPGSWGLGAGRPLPGAPVAALRAVEFRDATPWTAA
jgi:ribosomal protein S18 acetylase RimI-like enzyme